MKNKIQGKIINGKYFGFTAPNKQVRLSFWILYHDQKKRKLFWLYHYNLQQS
jgi:hypothetical protein